ncbi:TPA: hypothetical protein KKX58_001667 [Legionella pneumophila]|nr:hypothetical protein [Legionella pneumophila]HBD7410346.1 hypothetical protein [Legionella pneumophila]HBD9405539.1 hypothetical protein [Legionella pneumophila]HBI2968768.1 hypothetical protein [Legionella pneumophila]
MPRITITIPDNLHKEVVKMAGKENDSVSYTVARLIELGLLVMNSKDKKDDEKTDTDLEDYCYKLIIQMNGIIKELAVEKFNFDNEKISKITNDTLAKFNKLKGIQNEPL